MKSIYSAVLLLLCIGSSLKAQEDCIFYPKDTITCYSMKDDVRLGSKSREIDTIDFVPRIVQKSAASFIASLDTLIQGNVRMEEVRLNKARTDYKYLANTFTFLYAYKSSPMVNLVFGVAIDSSGEIVAKYGIPDSAWYTIEKPFLSFCKASGMFVSKYSTTKMTKYL